MIVLPKKEGISMFSKHLTSSSSSTSSFPERQACEQLNHLTNDRMNLYVFTSRNDHMNLTYSLLRHSKRRRSEFVSSPLLLQTVQFFLLLLLYCLRFFNLRLQGFQLIPLVLNLALQCCRVFLFCLNLSLKFLYPCSNSRCSTLLWGSCLKPDVLKKL